MIEKRFTVLFTKSEVNFLNLHKTQGKQFLSVWNGLSSRKVDIINR